jgi:aquaporin Z
MGCAMGATAVGLIYSPWGKRSGAHFNPAVTLTFLRLGKVSRQDAVFYVMAQFTGAWAGVVVAEVFLGSRLAHAAVHHATTTPGAWGTGAAMAAELAITFVLMLVILEVSNRPGLGHLTGLCAGLLIAAYITFEAPISGMSMNPARTLGSALVAQTYTAIWVYWLAPPLGMLLAAATYLRARGVQRVHCAKIHHENRHRCIFCDARVGGTQTLIPRKASSAEVGEPFSPALH